MLNFTVGPVQMSAAICEIGGEQIPYFRTPEFSQIMFENERLIKKLTKAKANSRAVFLTGSGTASMEAVIMNTLNQNDKVLVVNGGGFGARFVELCKLHAVSYQEIKLESGKTLKEDDLCPYDGCDYTAFVVNIHETSTGVLYDLNLISDFCKRNQLFLIVDAISSFLADPINMEVSNIGAMIAGSQKALACPPGISIVILSAEGCERVNGNVCKCMYLDMKSALKNGERGQTPFTPAVGILLQINARLKQIDEMGGADVEIARVTKLANHFRNCIVDLPLEIFSDNLSNAVTPLYSAKKSAYEIFETLKNEYGIWVCPNGGELADKVFRVGHIGELTYSDNTRLANALKQVLQS